MIIYTNSCLSCFRKRRIKEIKQFCNKHGISLEDRRVSYSKEYQKEAANIIAVTGLPLKIPFLYHNGHAINLNDELERLI